MRRSVAPTRIVIDPAVYPRGTVDQRHVEELADALRAGANFPPLVVEAETFRLVDGAHRLSAWREVRGDAPVDCEFHAYASAADLFLEAVRRNATHGKRLADVDMPRVRQLAGVLSVETERLAIALCVSNDRLAGASVSSARPATIATVASAIERASDAIAWDAARGPGGYGRGASDAEPYLATPRPRRVGPVVRIGPEQRVQLDARRLAATLRRHFDGSAPPPADVAAALTELREALRAALGEVAA